MGRVIVVGSLNVDLEVHVPALPNAGQKVIGERLSRFAGGKGANQAVAARAQGAEVVMVGSVGDDDAGRKYLNRLASMGIALEVTRQPHTTTGHALITTDPSGTNEIVVVPAANLHIVNRPLDPIRKLGPEDLLLTQTETPADVISSVVRYAIDRNVRVMVNLSPYVDLPSDVIEAADPIVIHEADVSRLQATGATPKSLMVTRGKAGITWDEVEYSGPVIPDNQVVDTVGAGDACIGTIAAAIVQGKDRHTAVTLGLIAAAENVQRFGAQANPRL